MAFKFDKTLRRTFNLQEAQNGYVVTASGHPVEILLLPEGVHHCSTVVFKWAQLDVNGKVIAWHVSTATTDGTAQLGAAHKLFLYDGEMILEPSHLQIW